MKHKIAAFSLGVMLLLGCAGCGAKKTMDMEAFCTKVMETVDYDDEMIQLSERAASDFYDLSFAGLEGYVIYASGTFATANELAVMKLSDAAAVAAAKKTVEDRLADQTTNYENYRPDELFRLKNALIEEKSGYLLFSVSNDNDAVKKLFEESLK